MPFYTSKDALLHCKRASFTTQKGVDGKTKGKEIDKKSGTKKREGRAPAAPPPPPRAGGGGGMCLAGYGMLWVGEIKGGRFKAKSSSVNSQRSKVWKSKHALSHTIHLSVIRKFVVFGLQFT